MPASAGIVAVLISAPKRGPAALDAEDLGRLGLDLGGAGVEQRVPRRPASAAGAIRSMPSSVPTTTHSTPQTVAVSVPCGAGEGAPDDRDRGGADQREDRALARRRPRPRPGGRSCRSPGGAARPSAASGSVSIQIRSGASRRTRMSACMWPLRSSSAAYWPSPGASASTSLVSCPCRYSAASGPLTSSLPRAERSSRPHSSRSWRYWASSSSLGRGGHLGPILRARLRGPGAGAADFRSA